MITLTSDFGSKDSYVAEMKGAILTINPKATLVDVTHEISKFNIRMAAFTLASVAPYFPKGTIHLAVVDPGVGTQRCAIAVQTRQAIFVGPDNGVLMLAAQEQDILKVHELANPQFMLPQVSNTFHGRDIFAPAAAHLDLGVKIEEFGPQITNPIKPEFTEAKNHGSVLVGEVLHADGFGNVITNIRGKDLPDATALNVNLPKASYRVPFVKAYANAKQKDAVALVGSHGFLELALNQGSAAEKFNLVAGDRVEVSPIRLA